MASQRFDQLFELTRVRVLLFVREREALFWVIAFPLVLSAVLGWAFREGEVGASPVGLVDGPGSAQLEARLKAAEGLQVRLYAARADALPDLRKGVIDGLVELDPGEEKPRLTLDAQRPEAETARLRLVLALGLEAEAPAPLVLERVEEHGSRYIDFLFPGLLGMNLMGTGMWGIGFAIADTRQRKVLRRLIVTPMQRSSFFLSFFLSRLVFLALEVTILVAFGLWVLEVPFRSSALSFGLCSLIGAFSFAGLGLLCASRTKTIEGINGILNLAMMPMWLGSGVFFSYERFPEAIHPVLRLLPLTALNDALRAFLLDGSSLASQGTNLVILLVWGLGSFFLALKIFRWE